jgi:hypothetical protein
LLVEEKNWLACRKPLGAGWAIILDQDFFVSFLASLPSGKTHSGNPTNQQPYRLKGFPSPPPILCAVPAAVPPAGSLPTIVVFDFRFLAQESVQKS